MAAVAKAVVAICVVLVPAEAVGANGIPLNVGEAAKTAAPVPVVADIVVSLIFNMCNFI